MLPESRVVNSAFRFPLIPAINLPMVPKTPRQLAEDEYIRNALERNPAISPEIQQYLRSCFRAEWRKEHHEPTERWKEKRKLKRRLSNAQEQGLRKWQKAPSWIWHEGKKPYWLPDLAMMRQVTYKAIYKFAMRYPELTQRRGRYIFCRDEKMPGKYPPVLTIDGRDYFSMPHLARKRGVTLKAAHDWAKLRPHLCHRHRDRLYVRDEGWKPKIGPPIIRRDGGEYFSVSYLAERRGLSENAIRQWAQRYPQYAIKIGGAWYVRDEGWRPIRAEPYLWRDGKCYFSTTELAKRRNIHPETARLFARRHPHLMIRDGRYLFCRDEEWTSPDPTYAPPPLPPAPPVLTPEEQTREEARKFNAARRAKR